MLFSNSFKNFITIVSELTPEEKKQFLKFVTGAERLPYGGKNRGYCNSFELKH